MRKYPQTGESLYLESIMRPMKSKVVPIPKGPVVPTPMLMPEPKPVAGMPMLGSMGVAPPAGIPTPPHTSAAHLKLGDVQGKSAKAPKTSPTAPIAKALVSSVRKKSIFPPHPLSKKKGL
jgi:hypothetical protein